MKRIILCILFLTCILSSAFSAGKSNFVLWQLPSQVNTIGNSYVFRMSDGKVAVMDGGVKEETIYLRGFLAALGNKVDVWFVSHPHSDHVGALNEILKAPGELKIGKICHSGFSPAFCGSEPESKAGTDEFYQNLKKSGIPVVNITQPGLVIQVDRTRFKILIAINEDITVNPYNNTHTFETVEIRSLVDSLGIKKNYVSCEGLCRIE